MSRGAGVLRSAASLREAAAVLVTQHRAAPNTVSWEAANLLTVASALVAAAAGREETRGCHWRDDFPEPNERWRGHLLIGLADGALSSKWEPLA
jgi:L-aspartate oxidase